MIVTRDWQGQAVIVEMVNGIQHLVHHSRDYDRDSWTRLVEEVTGSGDDTRTREEARLSPAERNERDGKNRPRLISGRRCINWRVVEGASEAVAGMVVLQEAMRVLMGVQQEVDELLPGHQINKNALLIEIGVQYLVPPED